ncbi:MAG: VanZ family protein [Fimbriimonadales bacterium]
MVRRFVLIIVTLAWWSLILYLSGPPGGSDWTRELLARWFGFSGGSLETANLVVRKAAHVTYYGVLCGLLSAVLFQFLTCRIRTIVYACVLVLATATLDEWRQSFTPGRTGVWTDVLYDLLGVAIAAALYFRIAFRAASGRYASNGKQ